MKRKTGTAAIFCFITALILFQKQLFGSELSPAPSFPVCSLSVSFDLGSHLLKGRSVITAPAAGATVSTGKLRIVSATLNGSPAAVRADNTLFTMNGGDTLDIRYEAVFHGQEGDLRGDVENPGIDLAGIVGDNGISLTEGWYPEIIGLAYYRLTALVPGGFTALSEADEIRTRETAGGREYTFLFPHPVDGIDFIAGVYRVAEETVDGIGISTYFFPEDASLAAVYLAHAKTYFEMYNRLLVPYPYKRFSIVENFLPTGLSMPTFTLLGQEVLRLPFIPETSLGHEITHQWFGNYVYADYSKGNWLEAITSYLSDYRYQAQQGKGREYRKNILVEFQSYVTPDKDFPLRNFKERTDFASAAIGYGKGAMLFHMLEDRIGTGVFDRALRRLIQDNRFRQASWADVERAFEQESGKDLEGFFRQWLDRTGVPSFTLRYPGALDLNGTPAASFAIMQQGKPYKVTMPAAVAAGKDVVRRELTLEKDRQYFSIATHEPPTDVILDEKYDIMRALAPDEFPPVIARLLGDEKRLVVYPEAEKDKYSRLIELCKDEGFTAMEERAMDDKDIRTSSLLVLGSGSPVLRRLFAEPGEKAKGFLVVVRNNPLNAGKVVAYADGASKEEVDLAAEKIFHYGTYSLLRFEQGRNTEKKTAETTRGLAFNLTAPVAAVQPERSLALDEIIDALSNKPLILIGERHTNYEDHREELRVITGLFDKGRRFAVGMEMFQKPFQKPVDDYLSGSIDEREFLKQTEYFKRWVFDYCYYREIIDFAKAKGIPIVALNQRSGIMDKVAKGGLDALSPKERKEIPRDMNMVDASYRKRLKAIYADHPGKMTFENFYQSQILWDETMAHSAAQYMKEHPDRQMLVLAGVDHISYGSGIPSRIERLTGKPYTTLINGSFDRDIGTYVLFPKPLEAPFTARLGAEVRRSGGGVYVISFSDNSVAKAAGLEEGDIITSIDGWQIETADDIRIALFAKKPGETVTVDVERPRFLLGAKKLAFHVSL